MKITISLVISLLLISFKVNAQQNKLENSSLPLSQYDFNSGQWLLLYCDYEHDYEQSKEDCWSIRNTSILDSLKTELRCDLSAQADGPHDDVIELYKDGKEVLRLVYPDTGYYSFGELKNFFTPTESSFSSHIGYEEMFKKGNRLKEKGAYNVISRDTNLSFRYKHTLELSFKNINDEGYRHYQNNYWSHVRTELLRLYPEFSKENIELTTGCGGACYEVRFLLDKKSNIDLNRLNGNDVIRYFKDLGVSKLDYYIVSYSKKK